MKIGLLGMGTIGSGVFEIAQSLSGVECKKVLEKRFQAEYITDNIEEIVKDPEIELVVETMGGLHPAYEFAVQVLENKKHFVTANKLLVSVYGPELTALAKANGVGFLYGAACGGGIAYLANLEIARGIDRITSLGGILNGTTNYILDSMQSKGMDYAQALSEAQALGYAERDPSSDVDGLDTQRKLILACAVGFDAYLKPEDIPTVGISRVLALDTDWAKANGMVLRLCACAERNAENAVSAYVEPTLVAANAPEAAILSNVNYAWYKGESYGLMSYIGQGAGKLPTAANVLRDVKSISAGHRFMTS
ncbi:MAG: homoserine dehydrogenase, partial [Clostridia bacterium]|nr:homoserine dehydrogenase [Clostridia bacterium]